MKDQWTVKGISCKVQFLDLSSWVVLFSTSLVHCISLLKNTLMGKGLVQPLRTLSTPPTPVRVYFLSRHSASTIRDALLLTMARSLRWSPMKMTKTKGHFKTDTYLSRESVPGGDFFVCVRPRAFIGFTWLTGGEDRMFGPWWLLPSARRPREDAVILLLPRTYTSGGWTGKVEGEKELEKDRRRTKRGRKRERERKWEWASFARRTESSVVFQRFDRTNDGCWMVIAEGLFVPDLRARRWTFGDGDFRDSRIFARSKKKNAILRPCRRLVHFSLKKKHADSVAARWTMLLWNGFLDVLILIKNTKSSQ